MRSYLASTSLFIIATAPCHGQVVGSAKQVQQCAAPADLWTVNPQRFGSVHLIPIRPGLYSFTLLATIGRAPGAATTGTLDLWGAPSSRRHPPNRRITFVYNGAADLDLHRVGSPSVAYPVSSRDPGSPGVELSYDGDTHAVSLDLGNAFSPDTMRLDVGTILWVTARRLCQFYRAVEGRWAHTRTCRWLFLRVVAVPTSGAPWWCLTSA